MVIQEKPIYQCEKEPSNCGRDFNPKCSMRNTSFSQMSFSLDGEEDVDHT